MKTVHMHRWIRLLAGVLLVALLASRMPWRETLDALVQVRLRWWLPVLALGAVGVWARALRLHWILGGHQSSFDVWRSVALGYLGSLVLPAGGGELVKIRMIMKARGLDLLHAGSSIALDRLLDLAALAVSLALLGGLQELPGSVGNLLRALSALLFLAGVFLVLALFWGRSLLQRISTAPPQRPWLGRWVAKLLTILEATEHLRDSRTWVRLLLFQIFLTSFEVFTASLVLKMLSLPVQLPPWAGLQLLVFTSVGFAMPLLPGAAGSLQVAYILALRPLGVPIPQALAFSLLAHLGHILVVLGHGGMALLLRREPRSPGAAELS